MDEVTARQREIAVEIHRLSIERGFPPSIRELGDAVEPPIRSTNCVKGHLRALEKKGWLREREKHSVRTLVLSDLALSQLGLPRREA